MPRGPDAGALLGRALQAQAARAGCPVRIDEASARAWHSATFCGARHAVTMSAPASPSLAEWLGRIGESDFALPGHLVADISVDSVHAAQGRCRVVLAALTLDEA